LKEKTLREIDTEVFSAIRNEIKREKENLLMIASENYASRAVIEAHANVMTNKYAEGYPGARYYGGCEYVDVVENLAIERAKKIFNADHVNVQPHSGSQANMAVYFSVLKPGDLIMGMDLAHGGHLSHGSRVSFSGTLFKSVFYGVSPETERIDFDQIRRIAKEYKPKMIIAGASAYPRQIDFSLFKEIAQEIGAFFMADIAHIAGLIVAGLHPSPVGLAEFVTSTTHKTLRGPRGGIIITEKEYAQKVDKAIFPGIQGGPLMHIIAAKAVAFKEAMSPDFKKYQKQVIINAKVLAEELLRLGFRLVSGGTDNHLILMDLTNKGITGKQAEEVLSKAGIVVNKNSIPFDKRGPKITSGIRIGTPALTTRGLKEDEMKLIAELISKVLSEPDSDQVIKSVKAKIKELCRSFPIYTFLEKEG